MSPTHKCGGLIQDSEIGGEGVNSTMMRTLMEEFPLEIQIDKSKRLPKFTKSQMCCFCQVGQFLAMRLISKFSLWSKIFKALVMGFEKYFQISYSFTNDYEKFRKFQAYTKKPTPYLS